MYESKLILGRVDSNVECPFKVKNSIGIPCSFTCDKPDANGLINCPIARLDDNNLRYEYNRNKYAAGRIGDFDPV